MDARPGADGPLTETSLLGAVELLAARDADLRGIVDRFGPPPLWGRAPGYPTLVKIILEQQVSLSSAQAAFDRLRLRLDRLTPAGFLQLTDAELLAIGFSRQKARYVRALSAALDEGTLDLEALDGMDDEAVERELLAIPGIGPWTVTIYRLMALRRPDAWPRLGHRAGPVTRRGPRSREPADAGGDGRDRRGVAAVARGRGADPVARLPRDARGTAAKRGGRAPTRRAVVAKTSRR